MRRQKVNCIQLSVQIIAIANEPPSAILLILLTRNVNCCCTKALSLLVIPIKYSINSSIVHSQATELE